MKTVMTRIRNDEVETPRAVERRLLQTQDDSGIVAAHLAGSDPEAGFTEMAVRELGAERVIYGSDVPGRSFASQLAKVQGADIPHEAKRLILGGNLKRLLLPILKAKGVRL